MFESLKNLFLAPFHKQDPEVRAKLVHVVLVVAALVLVAAGAMMAHLAGLAPDPAQRPVMWTLVALSQLAIMKIPLAIVGLCLWIFSFLILWKAFVRSAPGRQSCQWDDRDLYDLRVAKSRNAGILQAALALALVVYWGLALFGK